MTVPDIVLLAELRAKGLRLTPKPEGRVHVAPRDLLTAELRARIIGAKPALHAALEAERQAAAALERRIRKMGARWGYHADDLAEALAGARTNPAGWLAAVEHDEDLHASSRAAGRPKVRGREQAQE
jgi:hypothetical protein